MSEPRIAVADFPLAIPHVLTDLGFSNILGPDPTKWRDEGVWGALTGDSAYAFPSNAEYDMVSWMHGVFVPPRGETQFRYCNEAAVIIPADDTWRWVPLRRDYPDVAHDFYFDPALPEPFWIAATCGGESISYTC